MSAHGYSIAVSEAQARYVAGRPAIVRARTIGPDQLVYVYGDTAASDKAIGTPTHMTLSIGGFYVHHDVDDPC